MIEPAREKRFAMPPAWSYGEIDDLTGREGLAAIDGQRVPIKSYTNIRNFRDKVKR
jgi:hypothetical protein